MTSEMQNRHSYFDFIRGIAILMVIGIHTYTVENSIAFRQLLNVAVPLFIAISGYFLSQKQIKSKQNYRSFLKKQLPKVYIPAILWSLPLYAYSIYIGNNVLLETIRLVILGFSIYYFVAFIMQCYVCLPLLSHCISEKKWYRGEGDLQ